jgi:hypothetical protein
MTTGNPLNLAAQYEEIGAAAARILRGYESNPATDPRFLRHFNAFLHKYQTAPLFLVGLQSGDFRTYFDQQSAENLFAHFRLPYPTMILDFPESLYLNRTDPCLVFIDTIGEGFYYIEQLRSRKGIRRVWENLTPEERLRHPRHDDVELGEGAAVLLRFDPDKPHEPACVYSAEFINDCDEPVTPLYWVNGYCTFGHCEYKGGDCPRKTRSVRVMSAPRTWSW